MAEDIEKKLPPKAPGKPPVHKTESKSVKLEAAKKPDKPEVAPKPEKPSKPTQPPKPKAEAKTVDANKTSTPVKPEKPQSNLEGSQMQIEAKPAKPEAKAQKTQNPEVAQKPEKPTQPPKPKVEAKTDESKKEMPSKAEKTDRPQKPEKEKTLNNSDKAKPPQKPQKQDEQAPTNEAGNKENSVDDKNLNVVEKALSVEELNQRKQRRIRNATYAMSAVVLLLAIALIIIIFWPAEQKVEAKYDLTFDSIPAVTTIEHSIYSEEVTGNIVTFKQNITIENPLSSTFAGYASFVVSVKFTDSTGKDISDKVYLRLDEKNGEDVFNLSNIKETTLGELENVPDHQIYVDLAKSESKYIYFTNVLAKGEDPYSILVGFLAKDQNILNNEIKMSVTIYGFNAAEMSLTTTASGTQILASNGQYIPAEQNWVDKVQESLEKRS